MLGKNGEPGRSKMLQVACQRTNEKIGWVAERGNQAHADSKRELAEWGRSAGNGRTLQDAV